MNVCQVQRVPSGFLSLLNYYQTYVILALLHMRMGSRLAVLCFNRLPADCSSQHSTQSIMITHHEWVNSKLSLLPSMKFLSCVSLRSIHTCEYCYIISKSNPSRKDKKEGKMGEPKLSASLQFFTLPYTAVCLYPCTDL